MKLNFQWAAAAFVAVTLFSGTAHAGTGWTGDTIQALDVYDGYPETYYTVPLPDGSTTSVLAYQDYGTFTVPGSAAGGLSLSFDLSSDQIDILAAPGPSTQITTEWLPVSQNGYDFFDTTNNPGIVSVTLDPSSTADGASNADVSFNAYSVVFNFAGQDWYGDTEAVYDVTFGPSVSAAPEPATWALMVLGMGGIGLGLRRSKRRSVAAVATA